MNVLIFVLLAIILPITSVAENRTLVDYNTHYYCHEYMPDPDRHYPVVWELNIKDGQAYLHYGDVSKSLLMTYLGRSNEYNPPFFKNEVTDAYYIPGYLNDGVSLNLRIEAPFEGFLKFHGSAGPNEYLCKKSEQ